jgi:hypothetical protein
MLKYDFKKNFNFENCPKSPLHVHRRIRSGFATLMKKTNICLPISLFSCMCPHLHMYIFYHFTLTVGAMGLALSRKNALFWINITWEPGLLLSCSFFLKLTDTFTYTVKNFKPCSFNGFVSRSVNVMVIFRQRIFVVFHEFCDENLKICKFSWKYFKRKVFATEW